MAVAKQPEALDETEMVALLQEMARSGGLSGPLIKAMVGQNGHMQKAINRKLLCSKEFLRLREQFSFLLKAKGGFSEEVYRSLTELTEPRY